MEKRILILTAGFGEGHNAAARGIRDGLALVAGEAAVVELHDIFAETFGFVNNWVRKRYLTIINRAPGAWGRFYEWLDRQENYGAQMGWLFMARARLSQLLLRFQPSVVVSVFPAYPHLLETIMDGAAPPFRRVVCITDSITVNAIWYRCTSDLLLVPNEQTGAVLARVGVPEAKVRVTGFPVAPVFAELGELRQTPVAGSERRVLYMINPGALAAPETIRGLAQIPDLRLTVTIGREERLRRQVEAVRAEAGREMEIVGWVERPLYDPATHRLVWSMESKDKGAPDTEERGVNYNTYALGREGYVSMNLVTGMRTVAVTWGYLGLGDPIDAWGADHIIDAPSEVLKLLAMA